MSSLLSSITTALTGLSTTQTQIQMVSDNLSNAGNDGYTVKSAVVSNYVSGGTSQVKISGYTRDTDSATQKALYAATSDDGYLSAQNGYMSQVQETLGTSDTSSSNTIADYVSKFASAWSTLESEPEATTAQAGVITAGQNLTNSIQTASGNVEALCRTVKSDISTTVKTLNADLSKLADYNKRISIANATGSQSVDLQDARDQAVKEISSIMNVTVSSQTDGTVNLFTDSGYELVNNNSSKSFTYDGTNVASVDSPSSSLNKTFLGGSLEAQINFIDTSASASASTKNGVGTIQKLRNMLDTVSEAFTSSTSSFSTAYNTTGTGANDFFYNGGTTMDRTSIQVNPSLVDGSMSLTTSTASSVSDTFNNSAMTFTTTSGQTFSNCSYETLATGVISYFQSQASEISSSAATATSQKSSLETAYADNTGVNTDTELVKLTTLQNAYSASAKVIGIVKDMMDTLNSTV